MDLVVPSIFDTYNNFRYLSDTLNLCGIELFPLIIYCLIKITIIKLSVISQCVNNLAHTQWNIKKQCFTCNNYIYVINHSDINFLAKQDNMQWKNMELKYDFRFFSYHVKSSFHNSPTTINHRFVSTSPSPCYVLRGQKTSRLY